MNTSSRQRQGGFTMVEICITMALLTMLAAVLFTTGVFVMRSVRYNMVASEARTLALQKIEEIVGGGFHNITIQAPYAIQTNLVQSTYPVYRSVDIVGHTTNRTVEATLAQSAYLEVHVNVWFQSPVSKQILTNSFSTMVLK